MEYSGLLLNLYTQTIVVSPRKQEPEIELSLFHSYILVTTVGTNFNLYGWNVSLVLILITKAGKITT